MDKTRRYIPANDQEALRAVGCPWSVKTLYKFSSIRKYPRLFIKVGGRLLVDTKELFKMFQAGRKK